LVGVCLFKWQKGLSDENTREFRKQAGALEAGKHDDWLHTIKACRPPSMATPYSAPSVAFIFSAHLFGHTHTHMQAKREAAATQIELTALKEASIQHT
jgi:hypothetical protein